MAPQTPALAWAASTVCGAQPLDDPVRAAQRSAGRLSRHNHSQLYRHRPVPTAGPARDARCAGSAAGPPVPVDRCHVRRQRPPQGPAPAASGTEATGANPPGRRAAAGGWDAVTKCSGLWPARALPRPDRRRGGDGQDLRGGRSVCYTFAAGEPAQYCGGSDGLRPPLGGLRHRRHVRPDRGGKNRGTGAPL